MRWILGLFTILNILQLQGQELVIKNNELLNFLYNYNESIESITCQLNVNRLIPQKDLHLRDYNQIILKNKSGLYILVDGTGMVYRAKNINQNNIYFERIDSTHFYGYNGSALIFSQNDTIFSFAGGGFWRVNGHLRYFSNFHHEWNIISLNKEIPTYEFVHYYDKSSSKLFYIQPPYEDEAIGKEHNDFIVSQLDLNLRTNSELGILNKYFNPINKGNRIYVNIPALNGTLISFNSFNHFLFDYELNKVYKLKNTDIIKNLLGKSDQTRITNLFAIGNTVYYTFSNDSNYKLHKFNIARTDFFNESFSLYDNPTINNSIAFSTTLSLLLILVAGSIFYFKKKRKQKTPQHIEITSSDSNDDSNLSFNVIENDLINKMIDASKANRQFSVEDVNAALGLGKKSLEIQKKGRTEAINRINHKFKVMYDVKEDLIQRIRSEDDRRFYKYIISEEHVKMVKK